MLKRSGIVTLERHIAETQRHHHPSATGRFSQLLYDIALAGKLVSHGLRRAGLDGLLGLAGDVNVQGEEQKKLDVIANETLIAILRRSGRVAVIASEEDEEIIAVDSEDERHYAVVFDPLDGSSNTEVNVSLGTIFGIYRREDPSSQGKPGDVLRPGRELLAAGYILYGPCTNMVYSVGTGVHGFTLDPDCGEFLLSHENIRFPETPKYFSANQGGETTWSAGVQRYVRWLRGSASRRWACASSTSCSRIEPSSASARSSASGAVPRSDLACTAMANPFPSEEWTRPPWRRW